MMEPWLEFGGVEVANSLRTQTYLRRGLGGSRWNVLLQSPFITEGSGYSDVYTDTYEVEPFDTVNLRCDCRALSGEPYVSPAVDPAPWYDSTWPESEEFLGILVDELTISSPLGRAVNARSAGGSIVGPNRDKHRSVAFSGALVASSRAGMEYAQRWLTNLLRGLDTEGCDLDSIRVLPSCPDDPQDSARFFRTLSRVGTVDGPLFTPQGDAPGCVVTRVEFQLIAGSPWLRRAAEVCIADQKLTTASVRRCLVTGEAPKGTGTRITIRSGMLGVDVNNIVITGAPTVGGACPSASPADVTFTVVNLPTNRELVIDSIARSVVAYDATTGEPVGGLEFLSFTGILEFIEAAAMMQVCLSVDPTAASVNLGTRLLVETIGYEP